MRAEGGGEAAKHRAAAGGRYGARGSLLLRLPGHTHAAHGFDWRARRAFQPLLRERSAVHADAGGDSGDNAARTVQFAQLDAYMQIYSPGNAVIVAGTNELGDGFFIPNALVSAPLATLSQL